MINLIYLHIFFLVGFGIFCIPLGFAYVVCESTCSLYPYLDIVFYSTGIIFLINLCIFGAVELKIIIENHYNQKQSQEVKK